LAGRVPLENVSESKTKMDARDFRNYQIAKKKNEPSGITHNIYKWALLERNSMQQNNIYNIPLPRGPGPKNQKQKGNERGINYPCGLKNLGTVV
jgi:hypothetical protein